MNRSAKRDIIYAAVVILALLLMLEVAAALFESRLVSTPDRYSQRPGWQTEYFGSLFDWHKPDPDLLWRFKANLDNPLIKTNSNHLLGGEISGTKGKNVFRMLLLGDSSPVGMGLASRRMAFGEISRYLIDKFFGAEKDVELINAAVSGYSSEQIVRFMKTDGWSYEPDVVILYCGNNDASVSGYYSDCQLLQSQKMKWLRSVFSRLAIYRVMRSIIGGIGLIGRPEAGEDDDQELKARVTPDRFGVNLRTIAGDCRQHNCPLIILKPPVPYLWPAGLQFKPFLHVTGLDDRIIMPQPMVEILGHDISYCIDSARFERLYGRGDIFTRDVYRSAGNDTMSPEEAIRQYLSMMSGDPDNSMLLNNLGVAYWRSGQYGRAGQMFRAAREKFMQRHGDSLSPTILAAGSPILYNLGINLLSADSDGTGPWYDKESLAFCYLDSALQADFFSLRIKSSYGDEIDKLDGHDGVVVIDLPGVFFENGGESLFIDHCHPTAEGHRLIAREILEAVAMRVRQ